jgi:hypothetical protein
LWVDVDVIQQPLPLAEDALRDIPHRQGLLVAESQPDRRPQNGLRRPRIMKTSD